jgi:hypothetical protein
MKPNTSFELSVRDIEIIEASLRKTLNNLAEQRLMHVQSSIKPEHEIKSVGVVDDAISDINNLLGRLHEQKEWFRPQGQLYIGG